MRLTQYYLKNVHLKFSLIQSSLERNNVRKIAIITEISLNSTNYGNNIQAYALNRYLVNHYPEYHVETILLKRGTGREITSYPYYFKRMIKKIQLLIQKKKDETIDIKKSLFNDFVYKYIRVSKNNYTFENLKKSKYDLYVVGSDIVWFQSKGFINKAKFLAFKPVIKNARKIAYAASMGENSIPSENKERVLKYISEFDTISLREESSVEFLYDNGITTAKHVCDPTLLLSAEEWDIISEDVKKVSKYLENKYAFVYIIGPDKHEKEIYRICQKLGIQPVFISCEKQQFDEPDKYENFDDCTPQEWIWMIKHSEFVFTDSFHGLIFSTIYKKRFFAIKRSNVRNLNIRLIDYLNTIGETDKLVDIFQIDCIDNYTWDYSKIEKNMKGFILTSKDYIASAIS